jgi:hypothetical protein
VRDGDIVVNGAGASRTLQITPTGVKRGVTTISIDASDSEYTTTRQFQLRVDDATGVANESEQQHPLHLHVYPSVASTNAQIILEVDEEVQTSVELMTHTGELVTTLFSGVLRQGSHNLSVMLAQYSSGLYWVRVVSGRITINSPVMVVR